MAPKATKKKARRKAPAAKKTKRAAKRAQARGRDKKPAATGRPQRGMFTWNELMTRDDDRAVAFFEGLFGWTHEDMPMGGGGVYRVMKAGGKPAAGIMKMSAPQFPAELPPHWMSYVAVDDVDAHVTKAGKLGGSTIHPPTDIPNVGRFALIKDPTGAVVAMLQPEGGVTA
jgi:uncharacterized protein